MNLDTRAGVIHRRPVAAFSALALLFAFIPMFLSPLPAQADHEGAEPAAKTTPASNPNLNPACGLEILMIIDETGSMDDSPGQEAALENAYTAFINALVGSGSKVGVIEFSAPGNGGTADAEHGSPDDARFYTTGYVTVTAATAAAGGSLGSFAGQYNPNGFTNWQEALWGGEEFEGTHGDADLVVFFTDGDPNTVDANTGADGDYSGVNGELDDSDAEETDAAEWAVPYANALKDGGTHVLGIGLGLDNSDSETRFTLVTGPGEGSAGSFDIATDDYILLSDHSEIAGALQNIATQLCQTRIQVTKYVANSPSDTFDPGTGEGSGFVKASGWEFDLTDPVVTGGFTWNEAPPGSTNGSGTVEFSWRNMVRGNASKVSLTETEKSGWKVLGGNCVYGQTTVVLDATDNDWDLEGIPDLATVSCEVYNTPSFLTLTKNVQNDDGGTAGPGDFTLNASGPTNVSGNGSNGVSGTPVLAGAYSLSENPEPGYSQVGGWTCQNATVSNGNQIVVPAGMHILCSVTNNDAQPHLTLLKVVDNGNGGNAQPGDWTLTATRQGGGGLLQGTHGVNADVKGGTYNLSESGGPSGYALDRWECSNSQGPVTSVSVASGDDVTCTAYNESLPGHLKLIKVVSNAYGTSEVPGSWNLAADGPGGNDFAGNGVAEMDIPAGDYKLSETGPSGWTGSEWDCGSAPYNAANDTVSVGIGKTVTCTVTNRPVQPTLKLVKQLELGPGANETESDFTLIADGPTHIEVPGATEANAVPQGAQVGTYELSEDGPAGYHQVGDWICVGGSQDGDEITLTVGQSATCTVTNASEPANLTLVKSVVNNHGGQAVAGDFHLTLNDDAVPQGDNEVVPNTEYTVAETPLPGYEQLGAVVCVDDDSQQIVGHPVTLDEGQSVTCTITNVDQPASITVVKTFTHDTEVDPDAFQLTLNGEPVLSGASSNVDANESYTVGETLLEGWAQVGEIVCEDGLGAVDHPVELANGQHVTCTITNGELPTVTVEKIAIGEDEATFHFNGDLGEFSFDESGGSETLTVEPGEYSATETQAEFWSLTDLTCDGGARADMGALTANFDVDYGDHQTCTFTNEQLPKSIEVLTEGVCIDDTPYLKWVVNPVNFNGTEVDITWLDIDPGDPLYSSSGNPLQGMMLWPGAVVVDGQVVDWPGWIQVDGTWVQGADGYEAVRPTTEIKFSVNPDVTVVETYPPGDPQCDGPAPQIWVEKVVVGETSGPVAFTFDTVGFALDTNPLAHGEVGKSGPLTIGDGYAVSEQVPDGWLDPVVSCVGSDGAEDPANIDLSVGETVVCTVQNEIEPAVLASVLVTVGDSCALEGEVEVGSIDVVMSVDGGATVVIRKDGVAVATLTESTSIPADVGDTYTWEATANTADDFTFPPGFVPSGELTVGRCNLPFTGLFSDQLLAVALTLVAAGGLAVRAGRGRGRHEEMDR